MQKYIILNQSIKNFNQNPFKVAELLLKKLNANFDIFSLSNVTHELSFYDEEKYFNVFKDIFEENKNIIALEDNSYKALLKAKEYFQKDNDILPIYKFLNQIIKIDTSTIVHDFSQFNVGLYMGFDDEKKEDMLSLLNLVKAKSISFDTSCNSDGSEFFTFDKKLSFKMASEILFDAFDSGCDFLVVNDIRSFNLFDTHQKELIKAYKRPLGTDGMTILSIAQVLLIAMGEISPELNLTSTHKVKASFL